MARQELKAIIGADARQFNRTMKRVKQTAGNIGAGLARAGAIGAAGLAAATVKAVNYGDSIDKASKRTGITAETFQKLSFSAELSGGSAADVEKAIKRMSTAVGDAQNGLAESVRDFDALGVSMEELKGKTPDEQLTLLLKKLSKVTDATKRTELAQGLFGRSGTALLPIISKGAEGFDKLFNRLEAVGGILSGENVAAAASLKDAFTELMATVRGVAFGAILENANLLQESVDAVTNSIIKMKENGELDTLADDFRSIAQVLGGIAELTIFMVAGWRKFGELLQQAIQPFKKLDELAEKIARTLNQAFRPGRQTREQFIESASGADALDSRKGRGATFAANQIRLNARRARQLAPAQSAVDQIINSGQGLDILGQIAAFMKINAENTGVVAGTISTGVS